MCFHYATKFLVIFAMDKIPDFYPDSDDTYLLIDSIEKDLIGALDGRKRGIVSVEVGSGGGLVSRAFLELCNRHGVSVYHLGVDVNISAATETLAQCERSGVIDIVNGDMFTFTRPGFQAEVILCNPPYVPSSPINRAWDIRASYAGGERGREFIDDILPVVAAKLARDGVFYLLLEKRNDIDEVLERTRTEFGFSSALLMDRKIRGEHLFVYRLTRCS